MARRPTADDAAMTDAHTLAGATSRLLIHTLANGGGGWTLPVLLRRALARVRGAASDDPAPPMLDILDLSGHRLLTVTHVGTVIDLALPAGTYHVTTRNGGNRRSYTVVLVQDRTTELQLPDLGKKQG